MHTFENSSDGGGSDKESYDEFIDDLLRSLSDDESDTEFNYSTGMLLESHTFLPFDKQVDAETDISYLTPLYENAPLSIAAS